ncbi:hypothetical protein OQA88_7706 [Cercophora sp. LCS_1]
MASYVLPSHRQGDAPRLNRQHYVFLRLFSHLSHPLPPSFSGTILDLGAGTGIWASEMASLHPLSKITGLDLHLPSATAPPNCTFGTLDAEKEWGVESNTFDIVHTRATMILLKRDEHERIVGEMFRVLKPGGWIELQELECPFVEEDGKETATIRFMRLWGEGAAKLGLDLALPRRLDGLLRDAGFEEVGGTWHNLPVGGWMGGEMQWVGEEFKECLKGGIEGIGRTVLMKGLGWEEGEMKRFSKEVTGDLGTGKVFARMRVVRGRKPLL